MTIERFPGDFRVGFLSQKMHGVGDASETLLSPKLQLLVLLRGRQKFYLEDECIELVAGDRDDTRPVAFLMRIDRLSRLRFAGSYGDPFRKISVAAPPDWLEQFHRDCGGGTSSACPLAELCRERGACSGDSPILSRRSIGYLHHVTWRPCQDVCRLAAQIISPPPIEDEHQAGLFRMSRGLEILRRAIIDCRNEAARSVSGAQRAIHESLRLHVVANLDGDLSLGHLEQVFGLNRRSIQRAFKREFGMTVREYIRAERLKRANEALQDQGVSIAEAAHIAGYSSPANFATAFRKAYGMPPNWARSRTP
ncbi:helix-turn-helix transcriptional regulator [Rhodobium gokarnense]|uniref:AraC-like DNA-binding protein n=1 Tax=Rhodobium gokarnense TaxID=364296 RepID=A0ABT3HBA8_9HYPH|nr:helix-turn-helix transcriptional regulator [Rhodobium gokarnense]MCW2307682.1 AraC-like DNA-binding protein [Rhodobium gokarnense]